MSVLTRNAGVVFGRVHRESFISIFVNLKENQNFIYTLCKRTSTTSKQDILPIVKAFLCKLDLLM